MKVPVPVNSKKIQNGKLEPPIWINNGASMLANEINWTNNKKSYKKFLQKIHPDCFRNQSKLDQRKEERELPRSLHIDGDKNRIPSVVKPGPTLLPRRRPGDSDRSGWAEDVH